MAARESSRRPPRLAIGGRGLPAGGLRATGTPGPAALRPRHRHSLLETGSELLPGAGSGYPDPPLARIRKEGRSKPAARATRVEIRFSSGKAAFVHVPRTGSRCPHKRGLRTRRPHPPITPTKGESGWSGTFCRGTATRSRPDQARPGSRSAREAGHGADPRSQRANKSRERRARRDRRPPGAGSPIPPSDLEPGGRARERCACRGWPSPWRGRPRGPAAPGNRPGWRATRGPARHPRRARPRS